MNQSLETKSLQANIAEVYDATPAKPYGGFTAIASDATLDRDGEVLALDEWVTPLPPKITVDIDHGMSVATTIGSAVPYFHAGQMWVDATFSSLKEAQHVRTLVNEGHISSVSIAAQVDRSGGTVKRSLLNVSVVAIPANPNARIVDAKAFGSAVSAVLAGEGVETAIKSLGADAAMICAIHDASVHLGAKCMTASYEDDDGENDEINEDGSDGADDGANKSVDALRLRLKALSR
ncbi:MAG: hypothetical protein QOK33_551 [Mycobacterium sp.]|jgi:hypothetical protein|nr:hypothetical protein [Mycobacterium sp.]